MNKLSLAALALLILGVPVADRSITPKPVALQGILHSAEFFGPPNYGEDPATDQLEHGYYLQLPASVATQLGGEPEALARVFFVQLGIRETHRPWVRTHLGSRVSATGPLHEPETGHLDSLTEIGGWRW